VTQQRRGEVSTCPATLEHWGVQVMFADDHEVTREWVAHTLSK